MYRGKSPQRGNVWICEYVLLECTIVSMGITLIKLNGNVNYNLFSQRGRDVAKLSL